MSDETVTLKNELIEANSLLRSAYQIAAREGRETNWDAFAKQLETALERERKMIYASAQAPSYDLKHTDHDVAERAPPKHSEPSRLLVIAANSMRRAVSDTLRRGEHVPRQVLNVYPLLCNRLDEMGVEMIEDEEGE